MGSDLPWCFFSSLFQCFCFFFFVSSRVSSVSLSRRVLLYGFLLVGLVLCRFWGSRKEKSNKKNAIYTIYNTYAHDYLSVFCFFQFSRAGFFLKTPWQCFFFFLIADLARQWLGRCKNGLHLCGVHVGVCDFPTFFFFKSVSEIDTLK